MAISSAATNLLGALLPEWHLLLQGWSASGRLTAAAREALLLDGEPQALKVLVNQWSLGDFQAVPEVVLLSNTDINGALGAYAQSTGKIYFNADWLEIASKESVNAVLTEELGHYLDSKLNQKDTQGDEGEYFSDLLQGDVLTVAKKEVLRAESDAVKVNADSTSISAEAAAGSSASNQLLSSLNWDKVQRISTGTLIDVDDDGVADFSFLIAPWGGDGPSQGIRLQWQKSIVLGSLDGSWIGDPIQTYANVSQANIDSQFSAGNGQFRDVMWVDTFITKISVQGKEDIRFVINIDDAGGSNHYLYARYAVPGHVNRAPSDIRISSSGIKENSAAGTVIGSLSANDPDAGSSFSYVLVAGNGTNDADNALVDIVGNEVRVKSGALIDFETNPLLNLNIQVTDNGNPGLSCAKAVTASVLNVDEAPLVRGNSIYTIVDGPSWTQAEANSVKLGGHLVTVNNSSENTWLSSIFKPDIERGYAWIGFTDRAEEGKWKWVSGDPSTFANFVQGAPNNYTGQYPTYGGIQVTDSSGEDFAATGTNSLWQDYADNHADVYSGGIAETPFIRRGDSAYVIVQGPTWEEAEENAVKLGGHLVTINDAAENDFLYANLFNPLGGWESSKWIGLTDSTKEGDWKWISYEAESYRNWASGEPSNAYHTSAGEDFAAISPSNYWFDITNTPSDAGNDWPINGFLGIAEIKLAPNNNPTGTPTLSGTFKAGQVITIDKTPIQDADNFTGYTPDFKYSWEIANHPGMTMMMPNWESLKTADATDGNETFTITADLTGKLIRGVVSYLDGYGTNESLASTGSSPIQPGINLDIGSTSTTVSKTTRLAATISRMILTGIGNINATGNALNNHLTGNNGNNILDGGVGNDILAGGRGNDTYIVDSIYDSIVENIYEGIEIIQSSVNWTLGANLENLTLMGSGNLSGTGNELNNTIIGNSGNNVLDGGSGVDILDGGSGNDTLIGGLGNDVMKGGSGNDTYYVNAIGDSIVDTIGIDTVSSSISWTLGSILENLTLTGTDALTGIGNSLKNIIIGNAGNNVLDGFGDKDILTGGAGADTFRFSTRPSFGALAADHISDFKGSEGDLLQISKSAFGLASNATASLTTVSSATALTNALGSTSAFVYDSSNGNLYWNQNGNRSGFGNGGIFAVLDNKSALTSSNISLF